MVERHLERLSRTGHGQILSCLTDDAPGRFGAFRPEVRDGLICERPAFVTSLEEDVR